MGRYEGKKKNEKKMYQLTRAGECLLFMKVGLVASCKCPLTSGEM